jgi:type I restriction enzyme M protein
MPNISSIVKNVRNIMRQDRGVSGDAQRLEQLGWLLFLKILDDKDQELELIRDRYKSVIPTRFQWRNWAADPEGITGDDLIRFIDDPPTKEDPSGGLFAALKTLSVPHAKQRAALVREVFDGSNNYMKSGYELRKVINQLNGFDFNNSDDRHVFGTVYESILVELRDAGNKGEYYTPRAITQLMTQVTAPKLGEKVLDPAAGTGGFLSAAIDFIRGREVHTLDDEEILQTSITGWELKPVSYVLGLTNLILHGIDVPDWHYLDSLKTEYNSISPKQQVDVILANPPFGASIADGVESNFPQSFRCRESADLFVILMIQMLKPGGRCAIVLPDGCITGEGYKERIREKLITDCNLHTIVRLPQSTFHPATVSTNLLFFQKGTPTKEIWYYEHPLPIGQKSYSKTKAIEFDEFAPMLEWWNKRDENSAAWRVNVADLKRGFDLDVKNPHSKDEKLGRTTERLLGDLLKQQIKISSLLDNLDRTVIQK